MNQTAFPFETSNLFFVTSALRRFLGGVFLRGLMSQAQMYLIHRRLGGISAKILRLAAQFAAGTLVQRQPRAVACEVVAVKAKALPNPRPVSIWPRQSHWLVRWAGYHAAGHGSQFRHLLSHPDMVALLIAAPQAARILRPMCRMLGVETALLRPRADGSIEPAPVKVAKEKTKRVRRKREPVYQGRIKLPRGVLSACRRAGFYPDP